MTELSEPDPGQPLTGRHFAILGQPKYSDDFTHFDYVNPQAPKGGTIKFAALGNYDNFNRFSRRGAPEGRSGELFETLFTMSEDEKGSYYPLLAESVTYSADYSWAEVSINPAARFHDNSPVTAEDVEFSFDKFMTEGVPQYRSYQQGVTVETIAPLTVKITLPEPNRERLIGFLSSLRILPKHFWQDHRLDEPLSTPPFGSGPYYISDYKLGQYAVYQRDPNYWGKDLPVNVGRYNFDQIRYDYYLDDSVALEAFKAGAYDFRLEGQPKNWNTQYTGDNFDQGYIIKTELDVTEAPNARWLAFNINRPIFSDRKVREALTLAFDFNWLNRAFYYDTYKQPQSYFENTEYAASGLPTEEELQWLTPFKEVIPPAAFGEAFQLPPSDGSGFNRDNLLKADQLLKEAGWIIENQQRVNAITKEPFEFELLLYMGSNLQYVQPFQKNLQRLGINMKISMVDYAQINSRMRVLDYDMLPSVYYAYTYPASSLKIMWGSDYLNSSWNSSGLHNEAIDSLLQSIENNQDNADNLLSLGRALDRVLTHEYAMIPMWYPRYTFYAYWNKFSLPEIKPKYAMGLDTWWYDKDKVQILPTNRQ
ncbi:ABC transporter substrate-binding protein [Zophobihabitans entericus]|uniref:ABC transporter substrate-binding protein n=2 Tax=Zophobihabitans entericus TaxID=1635327 RepID=A0A6G9IDS8_9GAMM|nr:ABC transporter substrate-binding protein [Zophobihabitans entericus]